MASKKSLTLREFIDHLGPNELAMRLNVSKQAVSTWYTLTSAPKPITAGQIIELSHGLVSWESIYKPYVDFNSGEK